MRGRARGGRFDYGLGAVFSDLDRDGDLDLYVANDTNPNRLYENVPWPGGAEADPGRARLPLRGARGAARAWPTRTPGWASPRPTTTGTAAPTCSSPTRAASSHAVYRSQPLRRAAARRSWTFGPTWDRASPDRRAGACRGRISTSTPISTSSSPTAASRSRASSRTPTDSQLFENLAARCAGASTTPTRRRSARRRPEHRARERRGRLRQRRRSRRRGHLARGSAPTAREHGHRRQLARGASSTASTRARRSPWCSPTAASSVREVTCRQQLPLVRGPAPALRARAGREGPRARRALARRRRDAADDVAANQVVSCWRRRGERAA